MASYSVTEAKRHFSRLIDRALAGEEVVITRRGRPVIIFAPVPQLTATRARRDEAA
jgi:prevent-host-death family protein